ncbi:hypothetical protein [Promineifilum sp.]|uniref:hypothetical protein n=1 Tax=Promineifilum sp. TaxID=2664178 RepID=UPI0035B3850B
MEAELSTIQFPAQADVRIEISVAAHLGITAQSAQRKVSKLLLDHVGNLLYGEAPNLVAGARLLWRVPVWLSSPARGPVGQVGVLDVDAQTGEVLYSPESLKTIEDQAHVLAQHSAPDADRA